MGTVLRFGVVGALALGACSAHDAPDASGPDARWLLPPSGVDLLFVVDSSNSMIEEQESLRAELPRLVRVLTTGDADGDGVEDFDPVRSLHVGVLSTDLGAGPNEGVPTCRRGLGDDGILRDRSRIGAPDCGMLYPAVLEFHPHVDPDVVSRDVSCVLAVGTGGCGFEQPLEAMLKALTPSRPLPWSPPDYVLPRFLNPEGIPDSVGGHGDGVNIGFLRPASLLAIVVVSDEEDCSVLDYDLFDEDAAAYAGEPLNLRCSAHSAPELGVLHRTDRYVDGLVGLRDDPSSIVFAAIVGIPPETEPAPGTAVDFEAIRGHPDMSPRPDGSGTNLVPSCTNADGVAYPPTRVVDVAEGLASRGAHVTMASICAPTFEPAISDLIARLVVALRLD